MVRALSGRVLAAGCLLVALASGGVSCGPAFGGRAEAAPAPSPAPTAAPATPPETGAAPRIGRGRVLTPAGRTFAVEVVQDPESRARGLQNRPALPPDQGMVFVFPVPGHHKFWMFKCLIPLDIIWLDAGKNVIHLEENLPYCKAEPCPDYGPDRDALFVLELGAGVVKQAGIRPGTHLTILFDHPPDPR
jgi:uncharacterized membrane protein (UPF0127 family)